MMAMNFAVMPPYIRIEENEMGIVFKAACGCNIGKVRRNNEDNFFFDNKCLEKVNNGLEDIISINRRLKQGECVAVFDGMGGESFGEIASFVAAEKLKNSKKTFFNPFMDERSYLDELIKTLDRRVVQAQEEMMTDRMGTTMVGLFYFKGHIHICNVGDSRAYRLRDGKLEQVSVDHVERLCGPAKKAPLVQYLGFGTEEIELDPHIEKFDIKKNDMYLLCSDGLTDMLTDAEILKIMQRHSYVEGCTLDLIDKALEHGGKDNITVVVCKLV